MSYIVADILRKPELFQISRLDLEIILAKILNCSRVLFYSNPEFCLMKKTFAELSSMAKKRKKGIPMAYLTNTKEFYGHNFYVDERVLIPRPETEMIVEASSLLSPSSILDIGTGSGALSVTLKKIFVSAVVTAVDISQEALEVAKINSTALNASIELVKSDLLEAIEAKSEFDLIVANLPYVAVNQKKLMAKETLSHEPHGALFAGSDGLDLYRKCFAQLKDKKIKFKTFIGEFGFGQKSLIETELDLYFKGKYEIKNDLAGIPRIFIIKM